MVKIYTQVVFHSLHEQFLVLLKVWMHMSLYYLRSVIRVSLWLGRGLSRLDNMTHEGSRETTTTSLVGSR